MSEKLRVVFMGTPEFSVPALKKIREKYNLVAVYSQPDRPVGRGLELRHTPVKAEALKGAPVPIFQPEKLTLPGEFEKLQALRPDVIVVVAFGQILKSNVLNLPRLGCVNIHSSLLPRWRGAAPIHHAMLAGDTLTGVTTMKMDVGLDTGEMYLIEKTPIHPRESVSALHDRLSEIGGELIIKTLDGLNDGSIRGIPQNESEVTIAPKLTKEMETLPSSVSTDEADRRVRALNPWPGVSVTLKTSEGKAERLKIRQAEPHSLVAPNGKLSENAGMLLLGMSDGALELKMVQPEGKKEMTASAFLNGLKGRGLSLPLDLA